MLTTTEQIIDFQKLSNYKLLVSLYRGIKKLRVIKKYRIIYMFKILTAFSAARL